ncbi:hypothetical protein CROQUDRAFT_91340, partial [Cronartium quercuum f. sp. fusiforme G11]
VLDDPVNPSADQSICVGILTSNHHHLPNHVTSAVTALPIFHCHQSPPLPSTTTPSSPHAPSAAVASTSTRPGMQPTWLNSGPKRADRSKRIDKTRTNSCEWELLSLWTENLKNTDAEGNIIVPKMLGNLMMVLIKTLIETKDLLQEVRDATRSGTGPKTQIPATLLTKPNTWANIAARNTPAICVVERATTTLRSPLSNKLINQFKPAQLIIYAPAGKMPFKGCKPKEVTEAITKALVMIDAKLDGEQI